MSQALTTRANTDLEAVGRENLEDYVTFVIGGQLFGIPVLNVQDILTPENIANIPLAPPEVRGSINLRGRIVTVIDVRVRLGLPRREVVLEEETPEAANDDPAADLAEDTVEGDEVSDADKHVTGAARRGTTRNHMMGVTVDFKGELYTLLVDSVGDVISLSRDTFEGNPSTLDPVWREYAGGVYRLDGNLMVVLDVERLLDFTAED